MTNSAFDNLRWTGAAAMSLQIVVGRALAAAFDQEQLAELLAECRLVEDQFYREAVARGETVTDGQEQMWRQTLDQIDTIFRYAAFKPTAPQPDKA